MTPVVPANGGAIGYIRVSTDRQGESGLGMAAQSRAIVEECERRGWTLVATEQDVMSGRSVKGREGLERAIAAIEAGDADVLVIARLDRLIRSVADFAALLARSRENGWALVALDMAGVDTSTPSGEFLATVMAAVAQLERRVISERTKAALASARARGTRLGRPSEVVPDVARRVARMHTDGASASAIARTLNAEGIASARGGQWHAASVLRAVRAHRHALLAGS